MTTSPKNELSRYMEQVCKHPVLTREEELVLARKAKAGDKEAREKLIVSNLRFVVQQANKYRNYTKSGKYTIMDLIQEGNAGLVWAFNKYDPESGYRFTTYAVWWIKARIMNAIIKGHSMVKIGTTGSERKLFFKMGKIKSLLEEKDTDKKTKQLEQLAEELDITVGEIQKMEERVHWHDTSTDAPLKAEGQTFSLGDFISSDTTREDIDQQDFENKAKLAIANAMSRLSEREQDIIKMRWLGDDKATLQKIADKYGLSRERIRQIEARVFKELKKYLERDKLGREIIEQL